MLLTGLAFRPGDRCLDNDALVDEVLAHSALDDTAALRVRRRLLRALGFAGARRRCWTARPEELPALVTATLDDALARAGRRRDDVDLLISTSFDRSVLEPAHAYVIADMAGMHQCQCFDVTDGCNAWLRAAQLAQELLRSGAVRRVALMSTECSMMPDGAFLSEVLALDDAARCARRCRR